MKKSLFIVGMPRSGTKLFRDLCNQHSQINIPVFETHFFPFLVKKFGYNFEKSKLTPESLLLYIESTTFYFNMKDNGYKLTLEKIKRDVNTSDWYSVFAFILEHFAPKANNDFTYIGDKTPNYIYHLQLIKKIFKEAKIIVMIRDPRDNSLSMNKTFNKNLFRAAINWRIGILKMLSDIKNFENDVCLIKYEDLLNQPDQTMRDFCSFVGLEFEKNMLSLSRPTEKIGLTKGKTHIVSDNFNKYKKELSATQIKSIEELCYDMLIKWYSAEFAHALIQKSKIYIKLLKLQDGINSWLHHVKDKGFKKGAWYFFKLHQMKGKEDI